MKIVETFKKSNNKHEFLILLLLIVITIGISFFNSSFLSFENLFDILKSSSMFGIMAIGVTLIMISGGIDVSFPAIAAVAMHVTVTMMNQFGGSLMLAFLIASLIGVALGAVNAFFVSYFKLPTLIVTLATSNIYFGMLLETADKAHISTVPSYFGAFGSGHLFSFTTSVGEIGLSNIAAVTILLFLIFWVIMRFTSLGRNIYAIGGNQESAKRAGINIWKTQFLVYSLAGFLAGFSSMVSVSLLSYVNPFNVNAVTMDVIAAVVLGGTSLTGGIGSVIGSFLGVIMLFIIRNSLILLGVPSTWDSIIIGAIIIVSIALTMLQTKKNA
jgi:simple sugar transport system permease protein